jgi:hypothetical protein
MAARGGTRIALRAIMSSQSEPESPKPTYPFGDDDIVEAPDHGSKSTPARVRTAPRRASRAH